MTDPVPSHAAIPPWSTPIDACRLILRGVAVPFVVSSIGYLAPFRRRDDARHSDG